METSETLIEVKNVCQEFHLTKGLLQSLRFEKGKLVKEDKVVHAVNDVSFEIKKGEVFSLVGESGCGKSTTARTVIRLLEPTSGQVLYKGKDISHLGPNELLPYRKSMQMIFQDPYASLNPRQRVADIIMEPLLFHGIAKTKEEARERCMSILARVGLRPEQAGRYPHQFFEIKKGEVFSLVGESGCGKSTTARTVIRLLEPTSGQVLYKGKDISHLGPNELLPYRKSMQMIFQDPYASLNPRQRVADIIMEPLLFHGIAKTKEEARERCMSILARVGLRPEQAGRYPHQFSGGQRQRIGIARALAVNPEFIIADEPVSALDVSIQAQILNLLMDLKDEFNFSYLFIAHDLSVVRHISDRLGVMYLGSIVEMGDKHTLFTNPVHPYTKVLFAAVPTVGEKPLVQGIDAKGEIPSPVNLPKGCYFSDRCPYATDRCRQEKPVLREVEPGHMAACHLL